jgi:competence protein ComEA
VKRFAICAALALTALLSFAAGSLLAERGKAGSFSVVISDASLPAARSGLINLNTASEAELQDIPGIGPVLAGRIIAYRELHGPFASLEGLLAVQGIGEGRLRNAEPYITLEGD